LLIAASIHPGMAFSGWILLILILIG